MPIKDNIKKLIGQKNLGLLDNILHPELKNLWDGAFNGQSYRRRIFDEIIDAFNFSEMIETGSFRGNTTKLLASKGVPVTTIENNHRYYGYVASRFFFNKSIKVIHNDSRNGLRELSKHASNNEIVFFYLDAHWSEDLPLADELDIIFSNWGNAIVMIDDFQVPDTNYNFDDYGHGKTLNLEYLSKVPESNSFKYFFPFVSELKEDGMKRGCVILSTKPSLVEKLKQCDTLRHYEPA